MTIQSELSLDTAVTPHGDKHNRLVCSHCGASMNAHRHNLSRKLALCLLALHKAGGTAYIRQMDLPRNGGPNFQKLRYWNLVKKEPQVDRCGDSRWVLTEYGSGFLEGREFVPCAVWTYRGEFVRFEGNRVSFNEIVRETGLPDSRMDYARSARANTEGKPA